MIKVAMTGDSCVGKSSLHTRISRDTFGQDWKTTIGVESCSKEVKVKDKTVKIQFWDQTGQERTRVPAASYYRDSLAVLLIYDVSKRHTFENCCGPWLKEAVDCSAPNALMVLVGNKTDLPRAVDPKEVEAFATKNGLLHFETSALDRSGILEMVQGVAEHVVF